MKMKTIACLAFLFNTFLFGSFYAVSKAALTRIDPIVFTFFGMVTLAPVAICIIAFSWRHITRDIIKSAVLLGSCYCLGVFALGLALKYNTATGTAFFPSLNGLLAALFAWIVLRQPISKITWLAGALSVTGGIILITNASVGGTLGASIAFIGGLLLTLYIFLADREQRNKAFWPLLGVELLVIALGASLIVLLFGDWHAVHPLAYKDVWVILFIALGTNFMPTLITVLLQKYISPVTVSFIYILEPVMGTIMAYIYLRETLPFYAYIGGALIITGVIINTWSDAHRPVSDPSDNLALLPHILTLDQELDQTGRVISISKQDNDVRPDYIAETVH